MLPNFVFKVLQRVQFPKRYMILIRKTTKYCAKVCFFFKTDKNIYEYFAKNTQIVLFYLSIIQKLAPARVLQNNPKKNIMIFVLVTTNCSSQKNILVLLPTAKVKYNQLHCQIVVVVL